MKAWIPAFVLALLVMAWASWLFRYDVHTTDLTMTSLDRLTGKITITDTYIPGRVIRVIEPNGDVVEKKFVFGESLTSQPQAKPPVYSEGGFTPIEPAKGGVNIFDQFDNEEKQNSAK